MTQIAVELPASRPPKQPAVSLTRELTATFVSQKRSGGRAASEARTATAQNSPLRPVWGLSFAERLRR